MRLINVLHLASFVELNHSPLIHQTTGAFVRIVYGYLAHSTRTTGSQSTGGANLAKQQIGHSLPGTDSAVLTWFICPIFSSSVVWANKATTFASISGINSLNMQEGTEFSQA